MRSDDPLTAGKTALEERDRVKALAAEARAILNRLEAWDRNRLVRLLMTYSFSWAEAHDALAYIDWEDNRYDDGESDP